MSWLELENKTIIVTGGSSGIGKAIVEELIKQGANVVVGDLTTLESNNPKLTYVKCDVTNEEDIEKMFSLCLEKYGTLDVLINNAGINKPCLLCDYDTKNSEYELNEKIFNTIIDINVRGVFLCSQKASRIFRAKNEGIIINMSSESGIEGSEGQSIYAASKNAINSFTRSWAKELGKYNIRVVGVAPGILEATGLRTLSYEKALAYTRGVTIEKIRESYLNKSTTPLGRDGKLSEVADLVAFLASKRASYIHGTTIVIGGGKTRG